MDWALLFLAGLFETLWAIGLKHCDGLNRPGWIMFTLATMVLSLGLLAIALKTLPVGTAYPVWVGIGSIGAVILGILVFHEPVTMGRILSIVLVITGIIGLKICSVE
ncbi:MAG: DMT family transporter [Candidatus Rifleibacteriota bacterium]